MVIARPPVRRDQFFYGRLNVTTRPKPVVTGLPARALKKFHVFPK